MVLREVILDGFNGRNVVGVIIFMIGCVNLVVIGWENCMVWMLLVKGFVIVREWFFGVVVVMGVKIDVYIVVELVELFWRFGLGVLVIWKVICGVKEFCLFMLFVWVILLELFEFGRYIMG